MTTIINKETLEYLNDPVNKEKVYGVFVGDANTALIDNIDIVLPRGSVQLMLSMLGLKYNKIGLDIKTVTLHIKEVYK